LEFVVELEPPLGDDLDTPQVVEERLPEPGDLGFGRLATREDAEVDDDLAPVAALLGEDECGIAHAPLIPSRGSQRNIRIAKTSPSNPQAATAAIAPGDDVSVAPVTNVSRMR